MLKTTRTTFPFISALDLDTKRLSASYCRAALTYSRTLSTSTATHLSTCEFTWEVNHTQHKVAVKLNKSSVIQTEVIVILIWVSYSPSEPATMESLKRWKSLFSCLALRVCLRRTSSARQLFIGNIPQFVQCPSHFNEPLLKSARNRSCGSFLIGWLWFSLSDCPVFAPVNTSSEAPCTQRCR